MDSGAIEDGLEDEEKPHQPAEPERLERLAQVEIAAAAARQRRAELRVDEPSITARTPPAIHAYITCGPSIAATMNGMVRNGPRPPC